MALLPLVGIWVDILGSVGAVVHQEELDILGVVDEESLVAGGHHVTGLLVGAVTDLISNASVLIRTAYS